MPMRELIHGTITDKILRASFQVHYFLGNGFQEVIYQRALAYEMRIVNLNFQREIEQEIYYKNLKSPIGTRRADFVVEDKILVELKAVTELNDIHIAQALNCLKAYNLEVALLINFGGKRLKFKRFVLINDH